MNPENKDEKIYFGNKSDLCFACGEKVKIGTFNCPNCGTQLSIKPRKPK